MIPPGVIPPPPIPVVFWIGRGRRCRLTTLMFSTTTRPCFGSASRTRPCLPASLPRRTRTTSPFLTFIVWDISEHLRGQADDLHEVLFAQLAGDRAEDARAARVLLLVDDHGRVLVEGDRGAVVAPERLLRPHDDRSHDLALLD